MDFTFSDDQLLFRDSVRDFLANEVSPDSIRDRWTSETGRSRELWTALAELGLTGMLVPEAQGGLGMNAIDFVLLAEECGRAALPEPLVDTVLLATPVLAAAGSAESVERLQAIAAGDCVVAVQTGAEGLVPDADFASHLIMQSEESLVCVATEHCTLEQQDSVDPGRRLFQVTFDPKNGTKLSGSTPSKLYNSGALGVAAQLLGLAQKMVELSVAYTADRQQFGKPIGSFQAVKHHMANVAVKTEFAKAPVYRAAYSVAHDLADADLHVSQARLLASEAALLAAKNSIQVHGAMGYTWEVDLQIFMKRAWALTSAWGTQGSHKARVANAVFADAEQLGAGQTFASAS